MSLAFGPRRCWPKNCCRMCEFSAPVIYQRLCGVLRGIPQHKTYSNQWIDFRDNLQESPIGLRENLWFPVDFHLNQSIYSKPVTHLMVVYCWVYHNTVEYKWSAKGHFKKNRWMRVKRGPTLLTAPNHAMKNMMNFRFSNKLPSGKLT